jgi:serine phosphatase RsbU (regulator of sigma subunit)/anti-sigma regulatory factor (Ser/Thr protein kinase)
MTALLRTRFRRDTEKPETTTSAAKAIPAPPQSSVMKPIEIPPDDPLFAYCVSANSVIEMDSLKIQSPTVEAMKAAGVKLLLPLVSQGDLIGTISLGARLSDQEYSSDDFRLLNNLAGQASVSLRVAQLARQQQIEAAQRERIEHELRVAGIIQQTLLPREVPILENYELATYWQPARTVGGDFYDFISLSDGRLAIIIGDVTDKGVPAALVMASTRSILRAAAERLSSPGEVLERVNNVMCPDMPAKMFVTCLCIVLDPKTGIVRYANAGHNPAIQRTSEGVVELRARGMPLGLMPGMAYEEKETSLSPGDTILMYSDGLTEAHNTSREMFGSERLQQTVSGYPGGAALIPSLRDALFTFTGAEWEQEDDVTFVVLQRTVGNMQPESNNHTHTLADFELPSEPGGERTAMEQVAEAVRDLNLPSARLERLKTAVAETTMNAMEHGNHYQPDLPVHIRVEATPQQLSVYITDYGSAEAVSETETPDLQAKLDGSQSPRGWGLFLVRNMVDEMRTSGDAKHHQVELVMRLEGDQHA